MNAVERVTARLGPNGAHWIKRAAVDGRGGICLSMACGDNKTLRAALVKVIQEQYPDRVQGAAVIQSFNDHPRTVWFDVAAVLEKAALLVDEQAAAA